MKIYLKIVLTVIFMVIFMFISVFCLSFAISVEYLGHSCVMIEVNSNKILMDPYSFEMKYPYLRKLNIKEMNLVISTHEHFDHFNKNIYDFCLRNGIVYLIGTKNEGKNWNYINYKSQDFEVYSLGVYHDKKQGNERGLNSIVIIEASVSKNKKYKIVHLGDLGHMLDASQISKIANSDVLFVPVGGFFTISSKESIELIKKARPKMVFPIHYKTLYTQDFPIDGINVFLDSARKELKNYEIVRKRDKFDINEVKRGSIVYFELD